MRCMANGSELGELYQKMSVSLAAEKEKDEAATFLAKASAINNRLKRLQQSDLGLADSLCSDSYECSLRKTK
jgi:hypothetical protein